jgi:hypothetical protein
MNTFKLVCGITALTLVTDVAFGARNAPAPMAAQISHEIQAATRTSTAIASPDRHKPTVLADAQMDDVTAGDFSLNFTKIEWQNSQQMPSEPPSTHTYGQAFTQICAAAGTKC